MASKSLSSEFSFPVLASHDTHPSSLDSPQLWKRSSPDSFLPDKPAEEDDGRYIPRVLPCNEDEQRKSFSYVETRSRWADDAEEKIDMLWEDLNDELTRSRSLRNECGGADKKSSVSDDAAAVNLGCGIRRSMKVSKKTTTERKKQNVLVFMRVLKNLLLLRSSAHRSPAKTHPR